MSCKFFSNRVRAPLAQRLLFGIAALLSASTAAQEPFFSNLLKVYTPRSVCMFYEPSVIWLHLIADSFIALAYFSIPFGLVYFVRRRTDWAFNGALVAFAVFILACGMTHVMNVVALWHPVYRLDGIVKVITACASVGTAIMLWPLIPRALALPAPSELQRLNRQLREEIDERRAVEEELKSAKNDLERRVQERTAQLQDAHQRVTSILESISDCFCAVDRDWRYTYINTRAEAYFGLPKEAMLGRSVWEVFPHAVGSSSYARYQSAMTSREPTHFEVLSPVSQHWLAVHIYPSADGLAFFWVDIHVRKQIEDALAEARERFDAFIQHSPAPAWIKDEHGTYVFMNTAAERALGVGHDTWHGAVDADIVDEALAQELQRNDRRALASGAGIETVEIVNGRHLLVAKFPLRGTGNRQFIGGTAIDITDRIARETAERDASQRKDRFLAILSHELRNPLNALRGTLEVLRRAPAGSPHALKAPEMMQRQVAHLSRLLEDLLDVSRIAQGRLQLRKQDVLLSQIIEQSVEVSGAQIAAKSIDLAVQLPPQAIVLDADPVRLCQVFSNLLHNAAKYSPAESRVVVEARCEQDAVVVSVTDTGIGLTEREMSQLFQMFFSAPREEATLQDGLGVGLALSRTLVELHGGTIWASSGGRGMGSCFTVRLPMRAADVDRIAGQHLAPAERVSLLDRRILVVDDNQDSADNISLLLQMHGAQVRTAYDGENALQAADEFRPEAILLDIGLPGLNGYEVVREILRTARADAPLFIATTGWGQPADKREAEEAGFDHHLTKPIDLQQLPALLLRLLCRREGDSAG